MLASNENKRQTCKVSEIAYWHCVNVINNVHKTTTKTIIVATTMARSLRSKARQKNMKLQRRNRGFRRFQQRRFNQSLEKIEKVVESEVIDPSCKRFHIISRDFSNEIFMFQLFFRCNSHWFRNASVCASRTRSVAHHDSGRNGETKRLTKSRCHNGFSHNVCDHNDNVNDCQ